MKNEYTSYSKYGLLTVSAGCGLLQSFAVCPASNWLLSSVTVLGLLLSIYWVYQATLRKDAMAQQLNAYSNQLLAVQQAAKDREAQLESTARQLQVFQLSGEVAHEILNPLTSLNVRLQREHTRSLELEDYFQAAETLFQSSRMLSDLNRALQLFVGLEKIFEIFRNSTRLSAEDFMFLQTQSSRIRETVESLRTASKLTASMESLQLAEVVEEVVQDLQDRFDSAQIQVILQLDTLPEFNARHLEIHSLVSNILRNAYHALLETNGERLITIKACYHSSYKTLELQVADNGCGIPDALHEEIFSPRFTSKGSLGNGYGLSLCKKISGKYGGDIRVLSSSVGVGTVFQVMLKVL